jgi:hypothetical protein
MPRHTTFYIWSPDYTYRHSGVVCLHLLCHHLNRLGYNAYITGRRSPGYLCTNLADQDAIRSIGPQDIVVYPEIVAGNPLHGQRVVRYLLNRPGRLANVSLNDYGPNDYFIHFADEFRPDGVSSRRLWIPLVDRTVYRAGLPRRKRKGFLLFSHRYELEPQGLPKWVSPILSISPKEPREPQTLAALYRESRAVIIGERTAAINEAIHCGCPVVLMPNRNFDPGHILRWYMGCGVTVSWKQPGLARAERTVLIAKVIYRLRSLGLNLRIHEFARQSLNHFDALTY